MAAPSVRASTVANQIDPGTSLSIAKPTGTASGDVLALIVATETRAGESAVSASGFTQAGSWASGGTSTSQPAVGLFTKTAGASESDSYTVAIDSTNYAYTVFLIAISGASGIDKTPVASTSTTASRSLIAPTITPVSSTALLICAAFQDASSAISFTAIPSGTTTVASEFAAGPYVQGMAVSQALTSSAATGTKTFTSSLSSRYQAISFTVAPGAVAPAINTGQFLPFF